MIDKYWIIHFDTYKKRGGVSLKEKWFLLHHLRFEVYKRIVVELTVT